MIGAKKAWNDLMVTERNQVSALARGETGFNNNFLTVSGGCVTNLEEGGPNRAREKIAKNELLGLKKKKSGGSTDARRGKRQNALKKKFEVTMEQTRPKKGR